MIILLIMAIGVFVGFKFFPEKWQKYNHYVQVGSIIALIFFMGIGLGSNPTFMEQLLGLGIKGFIFAIVPIICSVGVVYVLTNKVMKEQGND